MKVSYTAPVKHGKTHIIYLYQYHKKSFSMVSDGVYRWILISKPYKDYYIYQHQYQTKWGLKEWYDIHHIKGEDNILRHNYTKFHHREFSENSNTLTYEKTFDTDLILNPIKMLGFCGNIGSHEFADKLENILPDYRPSEEVISHLKTRNNLIAYTPKFERLVEINYRFGPETNSLDDYIDEVKYRISVTKKLYDGYQRVFQFYGIPYKMFDINECEYEKETGLVCPKFILDDIKHPTLQKPVEKRFPGIDIEYYIDKHMSSFI